MRASPERDRAASASPPGSPARADPRGLAARAEARFAARLRAGDFPVALEITPPRAPHPAVLVRRATAVASDAVHVIQRDERLPSLDACLLLRASGLPAVWHLVARGRSRAGIEADLARASTAGVGCVLCLRGDGDVPDAADTPKVREVVALARAALPDALVGVTADPGAERRRVLANLLPKLRAGADFVETQPVFSLESYRDFARDVRTRWPAARLLPLAMPVLDVARADWVESHLRVAVPGSLRRALARGAATSRRREPDDRHAWGAEAEAGWRAFRAIALGLRAEPLADGIAIATPSADLGAPLAGRLSRLVSSL